MKNMDAAKIKKLYFELKKIRDDISILDRDIVGALRFEQTINSSLMENPEIDPMFFRSILYRGNAKAKEHLSPVYRKMVLEVIGLEKMLKYLEKTAPKRSDLSVSLILKMHKLLFEESWPDIAGRFRNVDVRVRGLKNRPIHHSQVSEVLYQHLSWVDGLTKLLGPVTESNFFEIFHVAADIHFRVIETYPFLSGNWRIARALSNYVLLSSGMFANIIDFSRRDHYVTAVNAASITELEPMSYFLLESYGDTLDRISGFLQLIKRESE